MKQSLSPSSQPSKKLRTRNVLSAFTYNTNGDKFGRQAGTNVDAYVATLSASALALKPKTTNDMENVNPQGGSDNSSPGDNTVKSTALNNAENKFLDNVMDHNDGRFNMTDSKNEEFPAILENE
ncbi:hypothetical protein GYMLUDRAFT_55709 [Collybiopsis luxurians FD-317 M1]|nr:hypothetical protein GYMLUDRAFT_55709 [Collybiopsis luxurians FD-317 M1]